VLALDGAEPADSRRDEHAHVVGDVRLSRSASHRPQANSAAATANWMKTSIFLTSFFSKYCSGSKPLTSPAMRAEKQRRVEVRDGSDAAAAGQQAVPVRVGTDADRGNQADTGHDHSPVQVASA
jgi:hypothetical protein